MGGLDYSIIKKFDTQYMRDMAQLADRVRQVERLKAEKSRTSKYHKREKVAYIDVDEYDSDVGNDSLEEIEVNVAELKLGPHYTCKLLKPSNGKIMLKLAKTRSSRLELTLLTLYNVMRFFIC